MGDLGHFSIILSFVTALLAAIAFGFASTKEGDEETKWRRYARGLFLVHGISVVTVIVSLFSIIYRQGYQYHYVWSHSSKDLPVHYMISCFWEGQEGSFLLWIFWHVVIAGIFILSSSKWENPVLTVFMSIQVILTSMIVGVVIGGLKIGSSPFILLSEVFYDAEIFRTNKEYVPEDGNGLNPLLQNYWMVIHPPTLFLGFATSIVPFCLAIAGLWKKQFHEWIKPALTWSLVSAAILGTGIIMGGFWAYETLNFGGYWNWDPVENAVYIPWMTQIAGIHLLLLYKKNKGSLLFGMIMIVTTFILVLYSTFLTRSGVLGESSVHSFTDLGLYWHLVLLMVLPLSLFIVLVIIRKKEFPFSKREVTIYTKDFWVLTGMIILILGAFQVFIGTSIPFFNKLFGSSMAPPTNAPVFYSKIQIWFAVGIALFAGISQYVWWNKSDKGALKKLLNKFVITFISVLSIATIIIYVKELSIASDTSSILHKLRFPDPTDNTNYFLVFISYILLLAAALFSAFSGAAILKKLWNNKQLFGGAIAHMGFAVMLIGILFSAGYSRVMSINQTSKIYSSEFGDEMNTQNVLLWSHEDYKLKDNAYDATYTGKRFEVRGFPGYLTSLDLFPTFEPDIMIITDTIRHKGEVYYEPGDTVKIEGENTYYEVSYSKEGKELFTLFPRSQINPSMGFLASPDIRRQLHRDLYTHVSSVPDISKIEWSKERIYKVNRGQPLIINDFIGTIDSVYRALAVPGVKMGKDAVAMQVNITFTLANREEIVLKPALVLTPRGVISPVAVSDDLGIRMRLIKFDPQSGVFTFDAQTTQRDYVILKIVEKPLINLLWIGTVMTIVGFILAARRRYIDSKEVDKQDAYERSVKV